MVDLEQWRWKARRLRAMSWKEIGQRSMRAVRERVAPLATERPETTWQRVGCSAEHWFDAFVKRLPLYAAAIPATERAHLLGEAERLLAGKWLLFGHEVTLDDPPAWATHHLLGRTWPDAPAAKIDYRRIDLAGGVKYTWELSRHQPLLRLAQAYALTGRPVFAERCLAWWRDWIERNPRGWGIHWTSALEAAIRVHVWLVCLRLLHGFPQLRSHLAAIAGALVQHGEFIERHLSPGSSANNHLIGEASGLAVLGDSLSDAWARARRWSTLGHRLLEQEALRQFLPDGTNAEQAFGYLPFVWEFYLHAYRWKPWPAAVAERLARSIAFLRNVMDPAGYVAQVGDEDDGTVVPLWSLQASRYHVVGRALATSLGCDPPPARNDSDEALHCWLYGRPGPKGDRLARARAYDLGGYVILPNQLWHVIFDAGPLGLGSLAAHGHSDCLAVWASLGARPFLVDAGTFAYHEEPVWRDYFRGTAAHNTVQVDGRHQSEMLGPFLWGRKARARLLRAEPERGLAEGEHDGFAPVRHRRAVRLQDNVLEIEDTLEIDGSHTVAWHWHFHPAWELESRGQAWWAICSAIRCEILVAGLPTDASAQLLRGQGECPGPGWYSPRFGWRVPCTTLRIECRTTAEQQRRWTVVWRFTAQEAFVPLDRV